MTKNADFGPNLAVFGPKILIFMGVSKSFGTNITENHQDNLSALFFGQALDQMGQKCRYLAPNASFGHGSRFLSMGPLAVILDLVVGAPHSDHMRLDLLHLLCRRFPAEGNPCGYVKVSFDCAHASHLLSPIGLELLDEILTIWKL